MRIIDPQPPRPLGPPPRKARLRRGIRNTRRAYRTLFMLVILVFGGWAVLDAVRLAQGRDEPSVAQTHSVFMMISCGLIALLALGVFLWSERALRRALHLARHGEVAQGQILATGKGRRKRARAWISYTFCTAAGIAVQGRCILPRTIPADARAAGTTVEVLYEPGDPDINKARLGLDFVEFG
jgi:hypothetical protein